MKKSKLKICLTIFGLFLFVIGNAQDRLQLTLAKAVGLGIDSSKQLQIAEAQVEEAIQQLGDVKTHALPQAKASFAVSEALIPTQTFQMAGVMQHPMQLPSHATTYIGQLGITQVIFGGNKIRYAKKSAELLQKASELQKTHDQEGVILTVIQSYVNLYEIDQNIKIIQRSIADIEGRIEETKNFKAQGLATQNDVLRFELQKSKMQITLVNLQNNRQVVNYALVTLLGLPKSTIVKEENVEKLAQQATPNLDELSARALKNRKDLQIYNVKEQLSEVQLKSIKGNKLPTLGAGVNLYYLNPNDRFFPKQHTFLVPITVGLNLSWNISSLYTNKHKEAKAKIQTKELAIAKAATTDKINIAVSKSYHNYQAVKQKIDLLKTSVDQAKENDRMMEEKFQNQLATTTDRIDANTLYYKSLVDLSIAKAELINAWYALQSATGTLATEF